MNLYSVIIIIFLLHSNRLASGTNRNRKRDESSISKINSKKHESESINSYSVNRCDVAHTIRLRSALWSARLNHQFRRITHPQFIWIRMMEVIPHRHPKHIRHKSTLTLQMRNRHSVLSRWPWKWTKIHPLKMSFILTDKTFVPVQINSHSVSRTWWELENICFV